MSSKNKTKRVRKSPQQRRKEIIEAATKLIALKGYNGISLQDVASELNMTQQGVLHYVKTKAGLLSMVVKDVYDGNGTPDDFCKTDLPGANPESISLLNYFRYLVKYNSQRRTLVQLYMVLGSESLQPEHPLHDYFNYRPDNVWNYYSQYSWDIPDSIGGWENMRPLIRMSLEAMDGIQIRWLRQPAIDMYAEWLEFEKMIFPSPQWDKYH